MRRLLISIAVLMIFVIKVWPISGAEIRMIRVGLVIEQPVIQLMLNSDEQVIDINRGSEKPLAISDTNLIFTCEKGTIFLNNEPISKGPLRIKPGELFLSWNNWPYRGEFLITTNNGKLNLINILPLEEYLRGVVPKEAPYEWPLAALKAQAIAARTYTIASLNRHGKEIDLCATTHCQVFGSALAEMPSTDQAVLETAGQIMVYNGKVISALYHSSSGGFTEEPANIWGFNTPYLRPVVDWDQSSPHSQWIRAIEWKDAQAFAARSYPKIGRLKQILPAQIGDYGKILKVNLVGDLGEQVITGEQFRFLMNLPSSNIQLGLIYGPDPTVTLWWNQNSRFPTAILSNSQIPGLAGEIISPPWDLPEPWEWLQDKEICKVVIRGSGWGHRVGLSQWGAKGMAEAGYNERQILEHYYTGIKIVNYDDLK